MKKIMITLCFVLYFLNAACQTTRPFDENYREKIKKVSIRAGDLPQFAYYGPKQALANGIITSLTGTIGSKPISEITASNDALFKAAFKQREFDPKLAIIQSFATKLQMRYGLNVVDGEVPDADIYISVSSFGLGKGWGFADLTKPTMRILFEMKDHRRDYVIWRESVFISTTTNESAYHSYEEWLTSPDSLKVEFMKSIEVATEQALSSFQQKGTF